MIENAVQEWQIDLPHSYMVGDRASDILCGKNAGIKTVLLESGYGSDRLEQDVDSGEVYMNLLEFAQNLENQMMFAKRKPNMKFGKFKI